MVDDIELVLSEGAIDRSHRPGRTVDVPRNTLDISLIQSETPWQPMVAWHEGLRRSIEWMKAANIVANPYTAGDRHEQSRDVPQLKS